MDDLLKLKELLDIDSFASMAQQLQQKAWLMHWALFIFFNHENGMNALIDLFMQDRQAREGQTCCGLEGGRAGGGRERGIHMPPLSGDAGLGGPPMHGCGTEAASKGASSSHLHGAAAPAVVPSPGRACSCTPLPFPSCAGTSLPSSCRVLTCCATCRWRWWSTSAAATSSRTWSRCGVWMGGLWECSGGVEPLGV